VVPSTHYATIATTPAETSSLRHFLSKLHAMIFVAILVVMPLIYLIMILCIPLSVSYFIFISSTSAFSFVLSLRNYAGSMPCDGSPVMCAMSFMSIEVSWSSHRSPTCVIAINCLTQLFLYWPLPKCGRSNRPKIPVSSSHVAHWTG
jgi:maltodextrin utilization protein YvdJ